MLSIQENSFFKKTLHEVCAHSEKVAIGFSGGADSLALSILLVEFLEKESLLKNFEIYLLCVNHNLRKEAALEIEFAKKFALKNSFKIQIFDLKMNSTAGNFHNQAHLARYEAMLEFCQKNSIQSFLTAHHKDDQIETFFMRLEKGLGPNALSGIRSNKIFHERFSDVMIFRPLLFVSKREILKFLSLRNQIYIIDRSNFNQKYKRSQIRQMLEKQVGFKNEFTKNFDLLMKKFWNSSDSLNFYISKAFQENISFEQNKKICIMNLEIFSQHPKETIIQVFKKIFLEFGRINSMRIEYDDLENLYEKILYMLNLNCHLSPIKLNLLGGLEGGFIKKNSNNFFIFIKR